MIFPQDAITISFDTGSTGGGASSTIITIPNGSTYTILGGTVRTLQTAGGNGTIKIGCSGNTIILDTAKSYQPVPFEFLTYKCSNDLQAGVYGTPPLGFKGVGEIIYVTRDINATTMATNTPYTEQSSYENGTLYHYDPLKAQIGIIIFTIAFIICTMSIIKLIRK